MKGSRGISQGLCLFVHQRPFHSYYSRNLRNVCEGSGGTLLSIFLIGGANGTPMNIFIYAFA